MVLCNILKEGKTKLYFKMFRMIVKTLEFYASFLGWLAFKYILLKKINYLTSLNLNFLICKMAIIILLHRVTMKSKTRLYKICIGQQHWINDLLLLMSW